MHKKLHSILDAVKQRDIQGILASGYDHLDCASFFFFRVIDRALAQAWLGRLIDRVTNAVHPGSNKSSNCLNIALTFAGIQAFAIAGDSIDGFSHEFVEGMNRPEAAQLLGDTDESEQTKWDFGAPGSHEPRPIHLLILLYGDSQEGLRAYAESCGLDSVASGLGLVYRQDTNRAHGDRAEPFGFRDGISQPAVLGLTRRAGPAGHLIGTGEFVLGYKDEKGLKSRIPGIDNWKDPKGYLAPHPDCPKNRRAFGLHGSYLVFRKLYQDVKGFQDYVKSNSGDIPCRTELIAAKMIGRWRSGAPLVLSPKNPGSEPVNDFLYMPTDPDGLACPIGSHIRRMNPRDSLPTWPSRALKISDRHRIIRRGRKYADGTDQGICFIALNADLLRQFEFLQNSWANDPEFNLLDNDRDPIVGNNDRTSQFTIQKEPVSIHLGAVPRFVTMKGGGYFFLPGIRTLRYLANC
jgi:Dyp-type peroxidase family